MVSCAWCGRSKTKKTNELGITFHRFPNNPELRRKWTKIINKPNWIPSKMNVLCSQHFKEDCFDRTSTVKVRLWENSVPTVKVERLKYVKTYNAEMKHSIESHSLLATTSNHDSLSDNDANNLLVKQEIFHPTIENANAINISFVNIQKTKTPSPTLEIKNEDTPTNIHLKRKLQDVQTTLTLKSKKLRLLQRKCYRQKIKINSLKAIVSALKKKNLLVTNILYVNNIELQEI